VLANSKQLSTPRHHSIMDADSTITLLRGKEDDCNSNKTFPPCLSNQKMSPRQQMP